MRNLLALFAAALLTFVGAGWYLGWYKVRTNPADPGHRNINIDVNGQKITEDLNKGREKLRDILNTKPGTAPNTTTVRPQDAVPSPVGVPTTFQVKPDGTFVFPGSVPAPTPR